MYITMLIKMKWIKITVFLKKIVNRWILDKNIYIYMHIKIYVKILEFIS